ncbi:MAG TPA: hypothetical protein GXZ35_06425 [Acholeplasmataceae bacterium]|jgi:hypothetical protein|nr:hypothetical protein [Acholeplasmataceae bacterium]
MNAYIGPMLHGFMVYWDEEKEAARYYVHLLIGDQQAYHEIGLVEVDRNTKYYSFNNLAKIDKVRNNNNGLSPTGKNYYVYVEAEDKNGKIISKTDNVCAVVETFSNTYNGTLIVSR